MAGRNGDVGVSGHGGGRRTAAGVAITIDHVDLPGRAAGRSDDGIEFVLFDDGIDSLAAGKPAAVGDSIEISLCLSTAPFPRP